MLTQATIKELNVLLHADSNVERKRIRTIETKEPETLEWIERYFKQNEVFYDVGANIGIYSLYAALFLKKKCQVFSFEPESQNYAKLNSNIYINGLSETVNALCIALTDHGCIDRLYINPAGYCSEKDKNNLLSGTALHSFHAAYDFEGNVFQPMHTQCVAGMALDDLWMKLGMPFPQHIKIDVDGIEDKVLEGMSETIRDPRLKSVLVEASSVSERDVFFLLFKDNHFNIDYELTNKSYAKHLGKRYDGIHNAFFVRNF